MDYSSNVSIKNEVIEDIDDDSDSGFRIVDEEINQDIDSKHSIPRTESSNYQRVKKEEEPVNVKSCFVWLQENPVGSQLLEEPIVSIEDNVLGVPSGKRTINHTRVLPPKKTKISKPIIPSFPSKEQAKAVVDEFEALGVLWGSKLRKLEETQKILAEDLVNQILKKGFFKELTKNTILCKVGGNG